MTLDKNAKILIVGSGTFGCSTALHLSRRGYTDITCLDKYPAPSPIAAGNDSNKMVDFRFKPEYPNYEAVEKIEEEATKAWNEDPLFRPFYHPVGLIVSAYQEAPMKELDEQYEKLQLKGDSESYIPLTKPEDFKKYLPLLEGDLPNWKGYLLKYGNGWVHARNSIKAAHGECKKSGVNFISGQEGEAIELIVEDNICKGVKTASGDCFYGDRVILSAGARACLLVDFKGQSQSKCFTLAHIKVTEEEANKFRDLPVLFNSEKGFFFEPDENLEVKICNEFPGYTNINDQGESIPEYKDAIPLEAEIETRELLKETIGEEFSKRPFVKSKICWCTDSPDRNLIISEHPQYKNLIIGSGDSGKSFMLIPVIGKYIADVTIGGNSALPEIERKTWRWRPETSSSRDDKQDRWGGKYVVTDIKTITEWTSVDKTL